MVSIVFTHLILVLIRSWHYMTRVDEQTERRCQWWQRQSEIRDLFWLVKNSCCCDGYSGWCWRCFLSIDLAESYCEDGIDNDNDGFLWGSGLRKLFTDLYGIDLSANALSETSLVESDTTETAPSFWLATVVVGPSRKCYSFVAPWLVFINFQQQVLYSTPFYMHESCTGQNGL